MHEHAPGEERFDAAAQAAQWETRHSERDGARWSGRPNGRLVAEVGDLTPGRALDVGCGEGAGGIWPGPGGWPGPAVRVSGGPPRRARGAGGAGEAAGA